MSTYFYPDNRIEMMQEGTKVTVFKSGEPVLDFHLTRPITTEERARDIYEYLRDLGEV